MDQFNHEYSRDIEPRKGGHGDNYYYQLVDNIRRYKRVRPLPPISQRTMTISGNFSAWKDVVPEFRDVEGDPVRRNFPGARDAGTYKNNTGRNDIVSSKVTYDARNIYFYVRTRNKMTQPTGDNGMLLFLNTDQDSKTGWLGYDFIVNRVTPKAGYTIIERNQKGYSGTNRSRCRVVFRAMK